MKKIMLAAAITLMTGCGYGNLESVKANAEKTFADSGYTITGYQGYTIGSVVPFTSYGGSVVWYQLSNNNGITYEAALKRWGNEYHIYSLGAVDAIKPTK